jgi:hypothetical protein
VNVKAVQCAAAGCRKRAVCGDPSSGLVSVCGAHRAPHEQDLRNRRCMFAPGCARRATYGAPPR